MASKATMLLGEIRDLLVEIRDRFEEQPQRADEIDVLEAAMLTGMPPQHLPPTWADQPKEPAAAKPIPVEPGVLPCQYTPCFAWPCPRCRAVNLIEVNWFNSYSTKMLPKEPQVCQTCSLACEPTPPRTVPPYREPPL